MLSGQNALSATGVTETRGGSMCHVSTRALPHPSKHFQDDPLEGPLRSPARVCADVLSHVHVKRSKSSQRVLTVFLLCATMSTALVTALEEFRVDSFKKLTKVFFFN